MDPRRAEQVRTAKRRQRQRDRIDGWKLYQIKLPADLCDRLRTGMREPAFVDRLHAHAAVRVARRRRLSRSQVAVLEPPHTVHHPSGRLSRSTSATGASSTSRAPPDSERALLDELAREFGNGLINV